MLQLLSAMMSFKAVNHSVVDTGGIGSAYFTLVKTEAQIGELRA